MTNDRDSKRLCRSGVLDVLRIAWLFAPFQGAS